MRKALATALALLTVAVAGCGSGGSGSSGGDPLDTALGYLPESAPFVVAIDTNLKGSQWQALGTIAAKFSFGGQVEDQLKQAVNKQGLNFDTQVKPLLGNPAVIAAPDVQSFLGDGNGFIVALEVKDKDKLSSLLKQSKDLKPDGSSNGATLYSQTDGGGETAQQDDVLLASDNKAHLLQALRAARQGRRPQLEPVRGRPHRPAEGRPLVRVYADVQSLLGQSPGSAAARKIKWVGALRTLGVTGSVRRQRDLLRHEPQDRSVGPHRRRRADRNRRRLARRLGQAR